MSFLLLTFWIFVYIFLVSLLSLPPQPLLFTLYMNFCSFFISTTNLFLYCYLLIFSMTYSFSISLLCFSSILLCLLVVFFLFHLLLFILIFVPTCFLSSLLFSILLVFVLVLISLLLILFLLCVFLQFLFFAISFFAFYFFIFSIFNILINSQYVNN